MNGKRVSSIIFSIVASIIASLCLARQPSYASSHESTINIVDMHEKDSQNCEIITDSIVDSYYGKTYKSNILRMDATNWAYIEYDLDGQFSAFSGTLIASDRTGRGASMNIAVFVDGELKWSFSEFTRQNKHEEIDINLDGAKTISIKTSNSGETPYGWIFFVNSKFSKSEQPVRCNEFVTLSTPHMIDSNEYYHSKNLMEDSFGYFHDGSHRLDASQNAVVVYNLEKKYSTLDFSIVTAPITGSGASMSVRFYFDNVEQPTLFCSEITKQRGKINFSAIDVSNVEVLKIETSNEGERPWGWLYIVDDILSAHTHINGDWTIETEATCTKPGRRVQYCTECGKICGSESIPAKGHTEIDEWIEIVPPTCAVKGKEVQYCSVCGDIIKTQYTDCLPHVEGTEWEVLVEASCTDVGKRVRRCIECNTIIETETIEMIPHNFSEWKVNSESPDSSSAEESRTCTICGFLETRELESGPTCLLIYIAILINIVVLIAICVLYPLKFRKFLTYNVFALHLLFAILILYYGINHKFFLIMVVFPIVIYLLPSNFFSYASSALGLFGFGVLDLCNIQSIPLYVFIEYIYILVIRWLKSYRFKKAGVIAPEQKK